MRKSYIYDNFLCHKPNENIFKTFILTCAFSSAGKIITSYLGSVNLASIS